MAKVFNPKGLRIIVAGNSLSTSTNTINKPKDMPPRPILALILVKILLLEAPKPFAT